MLNQYFIMCFLNIITKNIMNKIFETNFCRENLN